MALNNDFPVPLAKFWSRVRGTPAEVWWKIMQLEHGQEKHTELEWLGVLEKHTESRVTINA